MIVIYYVRISWWVGLFTWHGSGIISMADEVSYISTERDRILRSKGDQSGPYLVAEGSGLRIRPYTVRPSV